MFLNCGIGEDYWESFGCKIQPVHPKDQSGCSLEGLTLKLKLQYFGHLRRRANWKRSWCWERLRAGGEGDVRGWDGWMASSTQWTCVWVDSGSWWWTGRPGVLQFMRSQRVRHDWATSPHLLTLFIPLGDLDSWMVSFILTSGVQILMCRRINWKVWSNRCRVGTNFSF